MSLCNLSCIFVGTRNIRVAARSTGRDLWQNSRGLKMTKLDSCMTGLATSNNGEDDEDDELDSYDSWRR